MIRMRIDLSTVAKGARALVRAAAALALLGLAPGAWATEVRDSCRDCHSKPDFLVTHKKLYDYFQDWRISLHAEEGVTCSDCHGGDPTKADKEAAHGVRIGRDPTGSAIDFRNVPKTCGTCHEKILEGYRKSEHFAQLVEAEQERQGPNCVTCHGSMIVSVLDVNTVRDTCAHCHNVETDNQPEIPDEAHRILGRFLSIKRLYRYAKVRLDDPEREAFVEAIDGRMRDLEVLWHTFDLDDIEQETRALLEVMGEKRDAIRRRAPRPAGAGVDDGRDQATPGP
jgi:hypothetical protein